MPLQQAPLMDTLTPARTRPGPPPTDSLGAFPTPPAFSQGQSTFQHKPVLLGPSASSTPQAETTAHFTAMPSQTTTVSMWGLTRTDSEKPEENPEALSLGAWGQYTQPAGAASGIVKADHMKALLPGQPCSCSAKKEVKLLLLAISDMGIALAADATRCAAVTNPQKRICPSPLRRLDNRH